MTWGDPATGRKARQGKTLCGSGSSDCPRWRVTTDEDECGPGLIALSSSHDLDDSGAELIFRGHEWSQVFQSVVDGTLPTDLVTAIMADEAKVESRIITLTQMRDNRDPGYRHEEARELAELTGTPLVEPEPVS